MEKDSLARQIVKIDSVIIKTLRDKIEELEIKIKKVENQI